MHLPKLGQHPEIRSARARHYEIVSRAWRIQAKEAIEVLSSRPEHQRLLFIKSWNERAEGNYLEPDLENGTAFLEVLGDCLRRS